MDEDFDRFVDLRSDSQFKKSITIDKILTELGHHWNRLYDAMELLSKMSDWMDGWMNAYPLDCYDY